MNFFDLVHRSDNGVDISFNIPATIVKKLTDDDWKNLEKFIMVLEESAEETTQISSNCNQKTTTATSSSPVQQIATLLKETKLTNLYISINTALVSFFDTLITKIRADPLLTISDVNGSKNIVSPTASNNILRVESNDSIIDQNMNLESSMVLTAENEYQVKKSRIYVHLMEAYFVFCKKIVSVLEPQMPNGAKLSQILLQILKTTIKDDANINLSFLSEADISALKEQMIKLNNDHGEENSNRTISEMCNDKNLYMKEFDYCNENYKILKPLILYLCDEFINIFGTYIQNYINSSNKKVIHETVNNSSQANKLNDLANTSDNITDDQNDLYNCDTSYDMELSSSNPESSINSANIKVNEKSVQPTNVSSGIIFIDKYKKIGAKQTKNAFATTEDGSGIVKLNQYKFFKGLFAEFDLLLETLYQKIARQKSPKNTNSDSNNIMAKKNQTTYEEKFELPSKTSVGKNKIKLYCVIALINGMETFRNVPINTLISTFTTVFNTLPGHMIFSNASVVLERYNTLITQEKNDSAALPVSSNSIHQSANLSCVTSNNIGSLCEGYANFSVNNCNNCNMSNVSGMSSMVSSENIVNNPLVVDFTKIMGNSVEVPGVDPSFSTISVMKQPMQNHQTQPSITNVNSNSNSIVNGLSAMPQNLGVGMLTMNPMSSFQQEIGSSNSIVNDQISFKPQMMSHPTIFGSNDIFSIIHSQSGANIASAQMMNQQQKISYIMLPLNTIIISTRKYIYLINPQQPTAIQAYTVLFNVLQDLCGLQGMYNFPYPYSILLLNYTLFFKTKIEMRNDQSFKNEICQILSENSYYYMDSSTEKVMDIISKIALHDLNPMSYIYMITNCIGDGSQ